MQKIGKIEPSGGIDGSGKIFLIQHNTDILSQRSASAFSSVSMEAAEDSFEADGVKFKAGFVRHPQC